MRATASTSPSFENAVSKAPLDFTDSQEGAKLSREHVCCAQCIWHGTELHGMKKKVDIIGKMENNFIDVYSQVFLLAKHAEDVVVGHGLQIIKSAYFTPNFY